MSEDLESTFRPKQWCDGCSLPDVEGCWCAWCRLGHGLCHHCYRRWNIRKRPRSVRPESGNTGFVTLSQMEKESKPVIHVPTGCAELDKVTNGGILRGYCTLIWGGSGGGKTSLVMSAAAHMARATGEKVVYASSEQNLAMLSQYAKRLKLTGDGIQFWSDEENKDDTGLILNAVDQMRPKPLAFVYDSVSKALYHENNTTGTHSTLLAVVDHLVKWSARTGIASILTLHATNAGEIKGGMSVVHEADTVVELQPAPTENTPQATDRLRMLRCTKNRDGEDPVVDWLYFERDGSSLRTLSDSERRLVSRLA